MDYVNKFTGGGQKTETQNPTSSSSGEQQKEGGGFLGGLGDKFNSAAGGGKESEKNEDMLDKGESFVFNCIDDPWLTTPGVDFVQEKFLGGGAQDNEVCLHIQTFP
jgi:hypothetical protein